MYVYRLASCGHVRTSPRIAPQKCPTTSSQPKQQTKTAYWSVELFCRTPSHDKHTRRNNATFVGRICAMLCIHAIRPNNGYYNGSTKSHRSLLIVPSFSCVPSLGGEVGPHNSTLKKASWSVQPFLQSSRPWPTDRQMYRQTDDAICVATTGYLHLTLCSTHQPPASINTNDFDPQLLSETRLLFEVLW